MKHTSVSESVCSTSFLFSNIKTTIKQIIRLIFAFCIVQLYWSGHNLQFYVFFLCLTDKLRIFFRCMYQKKLWWAMKGQHLLILSNLIQYYFGISKFYLNKCNSFYVKSLNKTILDWRVPPACWTDSLDCNSRSLTAEGVREEIITSYFYGLFSGATLSYFDFSINR